MHVAASDQCEGLTRSGQPCGSRPDAIGGRRQIGQRQTIAPLTLLAGTYTHYGSGAAGLYGHRRKVEHACGSTSLRGHRAGEVQLGYPQLLRNQTGLEAACIEGESVYIRDRQAGITDRGEYGFAYQLIKRLRRGFAAEIIRSCSDANDSSLRPHCGLITSLSIDEFMTAAQVRTR